MLLPSVYQLSAEEAVSSRISPSGRTRTLITTFACFSGASFGELLAGSSADATDVLFGLAYVGGPNDVRPRFRLLTEDCGTNCDLEDLVLRSLIPVPNLLACLSEVCLEDTGVFSKDEMDSALGDNGAPEGGFGNSSMLIVFRSVLIFGL